MSSLVKIGPWGMGNMYDLDIDVAPLRLESITVYHGDVVDGLAFSYRDRDQRRHTAGPWGGTSGDATMIELGPSEFLTEIHGSYGSYYGHEGIAKLMFVTNRYTVHGPFGDLKTSDSDANEWENFSIPVKNNCSIVGFFGSTGSSYLSSIGVYIKPF